MTRNTGPRRDRSPEFKTRFHRSRALFEDEIPDTTTPTGDHEDAFPVRRAIPAYVAPYVTEERGLDDGRQPDSFDLADKGKGRALPAERGTPVMRTTPVVEPVPTLDRFLTESFPAMSPIPAVIPPYRSHHTSSRDKARPSQRDRSHKQAAMSSQPEAGPSRARAAVPKQYVHWVEDGERSAQDRDDPSTIIGTTEAARKRRLSKKGKTDESVAVNLADLLPWVEGHDFDGNLMYGFTEDSEPGIRSAVRAWNEANLAAASALSGETAVPEPSSSSQDPRDSDQKANRRTVQKHRRTRSTSLDPFFDRFPVMADFMFGVPQNLGSDAENLSEDEDDDDRQARNGSEAETEYVFSSPGSKATCSSAESPSSASSGTFSGNSSNSSSQHVCDDPLHSILDEIIDEYEAHPEQRPSRRQRRTLFTPLLDELVALPRVRELDHHPIVDFVTFILEQFSEAPRRPTGRRHERRRE